ncbi:MAG: hypothetical protein V1784_07110 [bacterium]
MPITIVGDNILGDEILGDDILGAEDMVGAFARPSPGAIAQPSPGAIAQRVAQTGQVVRSSEPTRSREQVLGFDSGAAGVAAAATANIISRPQVVFRPDRLVVPATIAAAFLLNDIRIGRSSQLCSGGGVPCEAFTQTAFGVRMKMDTAQVSMDVALNVTNISAGLLRFFAALIGPSVE